jgi:hypothetical protein
MPILLSSSSIKARAHRKALSTPSSSPFSFIIFFIAVSTFTVWSLGVSTCLSPSDHTQLVEYYHTEATYSSHFATVLLLLQQLSDQLTHILPAITALLLLHSIDPHTSSHPPEPEGGYHKAELVKEQSTAQRIKLFHVLVGGGGAGQTEEAAAPASK